MTTIILNGNIYQEADHGRFEASLIDNGEEIARTYGDTVQMFSGIYEDVKLWAESYGIENIERPYFARDNGNGKYIY